MRARLAQTILLTAGKLAKRLDPENVTITIKDPLQAADDTEDTPPPPKPKVDVPPGRYW